MDLLDTEKVGTEQGHHHQRNITEQAVVHGKRLRSNDRQYDSVNVQESSMSENRWKYWFLHQSSSVWKDLHYYRGDELIYTASTIPTLVGHGYSNQSARKVWKGYTDPDTRRENNNMVSNMAMQWGIDNEDRAISSFYDKFAQFMGVKPGLILARDNLKIGASVDNIMIHKYTNDLWVLEIKCPLFSEVPKSKDELTWKTTWLLQIQIQLYCTGLERAILWIWTSNGSHGFIIPRCNTIIKHLTDAVEKFHQNVINNTDPGRVYRSKSLTVAINNLCEKCTVLALEDDNKSLY